MAETATKVDTYKPTGNELKLIEALSNPENRELNVSEICELIGISRQAYYKMFKKPDFVKYYNDFQLELVKSNIGEVIKASIHFAITEPKCHGDRKMLLEMGKVYVPKQDIGLSGGLDNTNTDMTNLSPDERRARINELIRKRGNGTPPAS